MEAHDVVRGESLRQEWLYDVDVGLNELIWEKADGEAMRTDDSTCVTFLEGEGAASDACVMNACVAHCALRVLCASCVHARVRARTRNGQLHVRNLPATSRGLGGFTRALRGQTSEAHAAFTDATFALASAAF